MPGSWASLSATSARFVDKGSCSPRIETRGREQPSFTRLFTITSGNSIRRTLPPSRWAGSSTARPRRTSPESQIHHRIDLIDGRTGTRADAVPTGATIASFEAGAGDLARGYASIHNLPGLVARASALSFTLGAALAFARHLQTPADTLTLKGYEVTKTFTHRFPHSRGWIPGRRAGHEPARPAIGFASGAGSGDRNVKHQQSFATDELDRGTRPPEHDGSARHQGTAPGSQW